jgi:hypothetical protein
MKVWLCMLDERLIKGVLTYTQAFKWSQDHEKLSKETGIYHTLELKELEIEGG